MSFEHCMQQTDKGPDPYVANIERLAMQNPNFRTAVWTGSHLQLTMMCIPPCGEIGLEIHEDTDQYIRVEQGCAVVKMGKCRKQQDFQQNVSRGDVIFVPAGTWHNVINMGSCPLRVSSVYAPPHHPKGTIHHTKEDAERAD